MEVFQAANVAFSKPSTLDAVGEPVAPLGLLVWQTFSSDAQ